MYSKILLPLWQSAQERQSRGAARQEPGVLAELGGERTQRGSKVVLWIRVQGP